MSQDPVGASLLANGHFPFSWHSGFGFLFSAKSVILCLLTTFTKPFTFVAFYCICLVLINLYPFNLFTVILVAFPKGTEINGCTKYARFNEKLVEILKYDRPLLYHYLIFIMIILKNSIAFCWVRMLSFTWLFFCYDFRQLLIKKHHSWSLINQTLYEKNTERMLFF